MKPIILLIASFFVLNSCVSQLNKKKQFNKNTFKVEAKYTPYLTSMGKGRGIIFRVKISNINPVDIMVDSFYINNKSLPIKVIDNKGFIEIESNYLKLKEEPSLNNNSKVTVINEIDDPIITAQKFYPSWIIITIKNEKLKLNIENFENTK